MLKVGARQLPDDGRRKAFVVVAQHGLTFARSQKAPTQLEPPRDCRTRYLGFVCCCLRTIPFGVHRSRSASSISIRHWRNALFPRLIFWRLSEAHPGATAVLVDEFHARILKGASYDLKGRATRLGPLLFELVDSHDADARAISQVLLAPAK
jgi:hypothetical protein